MDWLDYLMANDFVGSQIGPETALLVLLVAFCIGHLIAWTYMWTHTGLSYSQMFTSSLLVQPVIVAMVMLLMSGSILVAIGVLSGAIEGRQNQPKQNCNNPDHDQQFDQTESTAAHGGLLHL